MKAAQPSPAGPSSSRSRQLTTLSIKAPWQSARYQLSGSLFAPSARRHPLHHRLGRAGTDRGHLPDPGARSNPPGSALTAVGHIKRSPGATSPPAERRRPTCGSRSADARSRRDDGRSGGLTGQGGMFKHPSRFARRCEDDSSARKGIEKTPSHSELLALLRSRCGTSRVGCTCGPGASGASAGTHTF